MILGYIEYMLSLLYKVTAVAFLTKLLGYESTANNFKIDFNAALVSSSSQSRISIATELKIAEDTSLSIDFDRQVSFMWKSGADHGNYIVELQVWKNGAFEIVEPTTEVHFLPTNRKHFLTLSSETSLRDTLYFSATDFLSVSSQGKFVPGQYRSRIFFEPDKFNTSGNHASNWVLFEFK
jgi:hypothetical protein